METKQIVVIHGGNAFEKYEEYIDFLQTKEVSLERLRSRDWKSTLGDELGENFDVLTPKMPNPSNARYNEWQIWFKRLVPLFDDQVIFVGHSLGGIFLAKYLSENVYPKTILATFLIAAPFNTPVNHPLVDFNLTEPFDKFADQGGKIMLFHSNDDKIVYPDNVFLYKEALHNAEVKLFEGKGHFNSPDFPELVEEIRKISEVS